MPPRDATLVVAEMWGNEVERRTNEGVRILSNQYVHDMDQRNLFAEEAVRFVQDLANRTK